MIKPIVGITPVVLAGGKSSRMGQDKAFVQVGGQTMIELILKKLTALFCLPPIVISNAPDKYADLDVRVERDRLPDKGPLSGIHAGLYYAPSPFIFVFGCDMPLLNAAFIRQMTTQAEGYDLLVSEYGGYYHPLHAIYSQCCLQPIEAMLKQDDRKLSHLFARVKAGFIGSEAIERIPSAGQSFANINTPADLVHIQDYLNNITM